MDQPLLPTPPVFTQTPVEPEPPKKFSKWLIVTVIVFLLAAASVFAYKYFQIKQQVTQLQPTPLVSSKPIVEPSINPETNINTYSGKYFSISKSTKWKFLSDINQSPATPEVLETVAFENDKARLNIQVGTESIEKVLASQDGEVVGSVTVDNVTATKKSGYGGIAGSVYSVNLVATYNGKTYLIGFYTQDTQNINSYEKDFDQILSTFKFTN